MAATTRPPEQARSTGSLLVRFDWVERVVHWVNAGQKLNAAFIAGALLVLLGTGVIMRWYHPWPLDWRTGATFVHDWLALAIGVVVLGHIWMALRDRDALRAMVVGTISRAWAKRHAPAWLDGTDGEPPEPPEPPEPR